LGRQPNEKVWQFVQESSSAKVINDVYTTAISILRHSVGAEKHVAVYGRPM